MADIFVSYARSSEGQAERVTEALRSAGYSVWRDDQLPAHRAYGEVIEERLRSAKAVVVVWSSDAVRSQWVRAEADAAREAGTLVQISVDGVLPPMPFNQIQCADLAGWSGDANSPGWRKVVASVASLVGEGSETAEAPAPRSGNARRVAVCVLPFINMSGDAEQEYFSDGISEDIITDLSKVSALSVVARNTAFTFKGKPIDIGQLARQLNVTHVLEGSVRKAGGRVRINAQLIDGEAGDHVWADRYDRDLTDIFAIQDEISKAIVGALQLKLLPKEKKAIETRGTSSVEAYNLYLMARQHWVSGNDGDSRRDEVVVRICRQATTVDPNYAQAWALMALAQSELRFRYDKPVDALPSAERALALDPNLPEAHCIRAHYLADEGKYEEAIEQVKFALELGPESWETNKEAALLFLRNGRFAEAIPHFAKAASLVETDYHSAGLQVTCYKGLGDLEGARRAARVSTERAEKALAQDPSNGCALGMGAGNLAVLGDDSRAREWIQRALMIDPENLTMRYNLACALASDLHDTEAALDMLLSFSDQMDSVLVSHARIDPDMKPLRGNPRFEEMLDRAQARLTAQIPASPGAAISA